MCTDTKLFCLLLLRIAVGLIMEWVTCYCASYNKLFLYCKEIFFFLRCIMSATSFIAGLNAFWSDHIWWWSQSARDMPISAFIRWTHAYHRRRNNRHHYWHKLIQLGVVEAAHGETRGLLWCTWMQLCFAPSSQHGGHFQHGWCASTLYVMQPVLICCFNIALFSATGELIHICTWP